MKTIKLLLLFLGAFTIITSCKKDAVDFQSTTYNIRMTDAPGVYGAVYLDIRGVEIVGNNGKTYVLETKQGKYNMLIFCNGMDTLVASGHVDASGIERIKLLLGPDNTVVDNGTTYTLQTPAEDQSVLILTYHQDIKSGTANNILLDFDAGHSIVELGGGQYKLKPVIRVVDKENNGALKGQVLPEGLATVIKVENSDHAFSTVVTEHGDFLLMGIPDGTYKVSINPANPMDTKIINDVSVTKGFTTNIGTITF